MLCPVCDGFDAVNATSELFENAYLIYTEAKDVYGVYKEAKFA